MGTIDDLGRNFGRGSAHEYLSARDMVGTQRQDPTPRSSQNGMRRLNRGHQCVDREANQSRFTG